MGKVLWIYRRCLSTWFVILELLWRHLPSVTSFMSYYGLSRLSYYTFHLPDSVCLLNKLLKNHSEKHFEHLNLLPLKAYIARQAGREREMSMVLSNFTVVVLSQKNLNLPPFFSVSHTYCFLGTSDISFPFYEGKPVLFSEQYGKGHLPVFWCWLEGLIFFLCLAWLGLSIDTLASSDLFTVLSVTFLLNLMLWNHFRVLCVIWIKFSEMCVCRSWKFCFRKTFGTSQLYWSFKCLKRK